MLSPCCACKPGGNATPSLWRRQHMLMALLSSVHSLQRSLGGPASSGRGCMLPDPVTNVQAHLAAWGSAAGYQDASQGSKSRS